MASNCIQVDQASPDAPRFIASGSSRRMASNTLFGEYVSTLQRHHHGDTINVGKRMEDLERIPKVRGPKLPPFPFHKDLEDIRFVRLLSSEDNHDSDKVAHSRVFQVEIGSKTYALKVFNFFSLEEIRPFVPMREHLLKDNVVKHHLDPFFAECRAFGRLVEGGRDHILAVRCHGYALLPENIEHRIEHKFGIRDWNRGVEDNKRPLRAVVKDYIRYRTPFGRRPFAKMREVIEELNKLGIYNMDIREDNYRGGRLFDFSNAITTPHLYFWTELYSKDQILKKMDYDLECFDFIAKQHVHSKNSTRNNWSGRLRGHSKGGAKAAA